MQTRRSTLTAVGVLMLCCSACSKSDRKPTFATTGKVVFGDKPVANATVVFHPIGDNSPNQVKPRATTTEDGSFQLTTYIGNDGAPAGDYQVTVELWLSNGKPEEPPSSRLNPKLARPETSGLKATIATAPNELQPFDVKK